MAQVTLRILEGLERGRVYSNLQTPLKIGREDDNSIQLNDDRVSRYHAKIQESEGYVILTDLQSTNGTRVNGFPVTIRVLQPGDTLWIGRCLLQYNPHLAPISLPTNPASDKPHQQSSEKTLDEGLIEVQAELTSFEDNHDLFPHGAPVLPKGLSGSQTAMLSDVIAYMHHNLLQIANVALETEAKIPGQPQPVPGMLVPSNYWQRQQQLHMELARYLREISEP
jgi:predicted component of type VI protein secretion system